MATNSEIQIQTNIADLNQFATPPEVHPLTALTLSGAQSKQEQRDAGLVNQQVTSADQFLGEPLTKDTVLARIAKDVGDGQLSVGQLYDFAIVRHINPVAIGLHRPADPVDRSKWRASPVFDNGKVVYKGAELFQGSQAELQGIAGLMFSADKDRQQVMDRLTNAIQNEAPATVQTMEDFLKRAAAPQTSASDGTQIEAMEKAAREEVEEVRSLAELRFPSDGISLAAKTPAENDAFRIAAIRDGMQTSLREYKPEGIAEDVWAKQLWNTLPSDLQEKIRVAQGGHEGQFKALDEQAERDLDRAYAMSDMLLREPIDPNPNAPIKIEPYGGSGTDHSIEVAIEIAKTHNRPVEIRLNKDYVSIPADADAEVVLRQYKASMDSKFDAEAIEERAKLKPLSNAEIGAARREVERIKNLIEVKPDIKLALGADVKQLELTLSPTTNGKTAAEGVFDYTKRVDKLVRNRAINFSEVMDLDIVTDPDFHGFNAAKQTTFTPRDPDVWRDISTLGRGRDGENNGTHSVLINRANRLATALEKAADAGQTLDKNLIAKIEAETGANQDHQLPVDAVVIATARQDVGEALFNMHQAETPQSKSYQEWSGETAAAWQKSATADGDMLVQQLRSLSQDPRLTDVGKTEIISLQTKINDATHGRSAEPNSIISAVTEANEKLQAGDISFDKYISALTKLGRDPTGKPSTFSDATKMGGPIYNSDRETNRRLPDSATLEERVAAMNASVQKRTREAFGLPESATEEELKVAMDKSIKKMTREAFGLPESATQEELTVAMENFTGESYRQPASANKPSAEDLALIRRLVATKIENPIPRAQMESTILQPDGRIDFTRTGVTDLAEMLTDRLHIDQGSKAQIKTSVETLLAGELPSGRESVYERIQDSFIQANRLVHSDDNPIEGSEILAELSKLGRATEK
jgi:hypothetical protein